MGTEDDNAMIERVAKLEFQAEHHGRELKELKVSQKMIMKEMREVKGTLRAIYHVALGMGLFYVASTIGLIETLKKIIF